MATCTDIGIPGNHLCETNLIPSLIMPVGVGGKMEDAGVVEYQQGDGVVGAVM